MADMYAVSGETLTGIADAIRSKTGSDEPMTVASMAAAIEEISGGTAKIETGDFTLDAVTPVWNAPVEHHLGTLPKIVAGWMVDTVTSDFLAGGLIGGIYADIPLYLMTTANVLYHTQYYNNTSGDISRSNSSQSVINGNVQLITDKQLIIPAYNRNTIYFANKRYHWIAIAW